MKTAKAISLSVGLLMALCQEVAYLRKKRTVDLREYGISENDNRRANMRILIGAGAIVIAGIFLLKEKTLSTADE